MIKNKKTLVGNIPTYSLPTGADLDNHRWSVASLLISNLLPLLGVLFLGWRAFDVVFLYWLENVVIGVINVLKIITCVPDPEVVQQGMEKLIKERQESHDAMLTEAQRDAMDRFQEGVGGPAMKLFLIPFFTFHYGMFCFVHGVFVFSLMLDGGPLGGGMANPFTLGLQQLFEPALLIAAIALAASHLISFFTNYLGRGEYQRTTPVVLMMSPYARIVVLHVAIILGAFLIVGLGSPAWLLVLLVLGKVGLDLKLHLMEHRGDFRNPIHASQEAT